MQKGTILHPFQRNDTIGAFSKPTLEKGPQCLQTPISVSPLSDEIPEPCIEEIMASGRRDVLIVF